MTPAELTALLEQVGAFQTGHFLLSSGMHSSHYIQCALLLQHPDLASRVCADLADRFRADAPQVVVGPAYSGMIVAHEVARALDVRAPFAERLEGEFQFRHGFRLGPGERALVVEDVVTTGAATREVKRLVERHGGVVVGVGVLVNRSMTALRFDTRFEALLDVEVETHIPTLCPLCQEGVPLTRPGSRAGSASR